MGEVAFKPNVLRSEECNMSRPLSLHRLYFKGAWQPWNFRTSHLAPADFEVLSKVQRADLTCDVIKKVAPLVLSKL